MWVTVWLALLLVAAVAETTTRSAAASDDGHPAAAETTTTASTTTAKTTASPYSWKILDDRPLPTWYDNAKFGIFIHWGVFQFPVWVPGGSGGHGKPVKIPHINKLFSYTKYAAGFKAEFYQPDEWADVFAQSGTQYVILTSKHHKGFCMWNLTHIPTMWNWNAIQVRPHQDVLGELCYSLEKVKSPHMGCPLKSGLYHLLYEWFNPFYLVDKHANFTTNMFV